MTELLAESRVRAVGPLAWTVPETDIDEALVCRRVVRETHDVASFVLASASGRTFAFDAGQYVTVTASVEGRHVERCYTISSPSTRIDELTVTVKRVPDGPVSNWLIDHVAPGDRLQVTGPFGLFTLDASSWAPTTSRRLLFLSAGSGVTPLMSMTRTLLECDGPLDVVFAHSARTPRDIVFRDELERLAGTDAGVRITTICEHELPDDTWTGPRGRLTPALLREIAPDLLEREVYTCGPTGYMDSVREMLRDAGVDPARCHEESFELGSVSVPPSPVPAATATATFSVEFRRSGRTVLCGAGTSVLQAALDAGVPLPSSCGEGVCGTCRSSVLSGRVDVQHGGGIRPREIAAGLALLCCSTPLDDLVIDA